VRPEAAVFAYGNLAEKVCPLVIVKDVALPIAVPAALRKEMLPVQDAAVPPALVEAKLVTFTCAVSELANPIAGSVEERVTVVVV
jgi:hypothetical protein